MLLVVVGLFGLATALLVYGMSDTTSLALRREKETAATFADVKRALIGWSVARNPAIHGANARPGELPCPDINPLDGFEDGNCAAGVIGRVPWKTLGIPEPKDGAGETLWYVVAGPFRIFNVNTNPIHSDTKGNITVYQDSTATAITTEAVAVIFSPGAALGAQNRDTAAALCPTTGTNIARNICAANYLETAAGVNNAVINGPFISAQVSGTFNDKVMAITTADLMPPVEQRVAREVRTILENYKAATAAQGYNGGAGVYPWADCSSGGADYGDNRGRIPWSGALPVNWNTGTPATPTLPNWLTNQGGTSYNWIWTIYYAVGKNYLENFGADCTMCEVVGTGSPAADGTLFVNNVPGKEIVIIMTGPAGVNRPQGGIGSGICDQPQWAAYLEDAENNDKANDRYVTPTSTTYARDRLYTIP